MIFVLKNVAQSFKKDIPQFDTIGRFGGDEIIVLVIGANEKEAVVLAEQSRVAITEMTFFFEGELVPVTMSFGVIDSDKCKPNGRDGETRRRNLLRDIVFNSLNALSRAKRTGKNKVVRFGELKKDNEVNIVYMKGCTIIICSICEVSKLTIITYLLANNINQKYNSDSLSKTGKPFFFSVNLRVIISIMTKKHSFFYLRI